MLTILHGLRSRFGLIAAIGLLLAAYQVQDKKMPEPLFNALIAVLVLVVIASVASWAFTGVAYVRRTWGIDVYRRNRIPAHQWLLDIAEFDRAHSNEMVRIVGRRVESWSLDPQGERPCVRVSVQMFNGTVYPVHFDDVRGGATLDGEALPEPIRMQENVTALRGGTSFIVFTQYIPKDLVSAVWDEVVNKKFDRLQFTSVTFACSPSTAGGEAVRFSLGEPFHFRL